MPTSLLCNDCAQLADAHSFGAGGALPRSGDTSAPSCQTLDIVTLTSGMTPQLAIKIPFTLHKMEERAEC